MNSDLEFSQSGSPRRHRYKRFMALGFGLILAVAGTAIAAQAGAIELPLGWSKSDGSSQVDLSTRDSGDVVKGSVGINGRDLTVTETTEISGDHRIEYSVDGQIVLGLTATAGCLEQFAGIANAETTNEGVHLTGATARGATGLAVTLIDGRTTAYPVYSADGIGYPFFDILIPGIPVKFDTIGVAAPAGCPAS